MCRGVAWPELAPGEDARRTCFDGGCAATSFALSARGTLAHPMKRSLYRKYRPQTFAEVVGQDHVARTLRNAVETDAVAHAYLFAGPRGTGKTSTARILAKALNCVGPDGRRTSPRPRPAASATLRGHRRRHVARRHRDGRRLQPRHRRHPRPARQGRLRAGRRALQGLHHRRGPHAHARGLQRAAQDAGGAAGARRLRARHHRAAQDPRDHPLALPALRLPPPAGARHRRACWRPSWSARTRAPTRSAAGRASRSRRRRCARSRATRRAAFATPSARSRSSSPTPTASSSLADVLDALGVTDTDLLFEITDIVAERRTGRGAAVRAAPGQRGRRLLAVHPRPAAPPAPALPAAAPRGVGRRRRRAARPRPDRRAGRAAARAPAAAGQQHARRARSCTSSRRSARPSARSATASTRGCSSSSRWSRSRGRSSTTPAAALEERLRRLEAAAPGTATRPPPPRRRRGRRRSAAAPPTGARKAAARRRRRAAAPATARAPPVAGRSRRPREAARAPPAPAAAPSATADAGRTRPTLTRRARHSAPGSSSSQRVQARQRKPVRDAARRPPQRRSTTTRSPWPCVRLRPDARARPRQRRAAGRRHRDALGAPAAARVRARRRRRPGRRPAPRPATAAAAARRSISPPSSSRPRAPSTPKSCPTTRKENHRGEPAAQQDDEAGPGDAAQDGEAQEELAVETVEASAGGGMVTVVVTGSLEIKEVRIKPEAVDPDDVEMLQDLVVAATNEALRAAQDLAPAEARRRHRRPRPAQHPGAVLDAPAAGVASRQTLGRVRERGARRHPARWRAVALERLRSPSASATCRCAPGTSSHRRTMRIVRHERVTHEE